MSKFTDLVKSIIGQTDNPKPVVRYVDEFKPESDGKPNEGRKPEKREPYRQGEYKPYKPYTPSSSYGQQPYEPKPLYTPPEKKYFYKSPKDAKLTVILIEDSFEVLKEAEKVTQIVRKIAESADGMLAVIHYGNTILKKVDNPKHFVDSDFQCIDNNAGEEIRLYDGLESAVRVVDSQYLRIIETATNRITINSVEIVGIGTCTDVGSVTSKMLGIYSFTRIAKRSTVTTKYFCLTESSFLNAAEIGFHSIGSISKNY